MKIGNKVEKNVTRKKVIESINNLLGIQLENYIVKKKKKTRNFIFIDITDLDENIINEIKRIGNQYKLYTTELNGKNELALKYKN